MKITYVDTILDVPYDELEVKEILFDYDGTLNQKGIEEQEALALLKKLQERFIVRVFSNNHLHARKRAAYFEKHDMEYVRTFKPFGKQEISDCVLVGDKFLTDGLYGLRRGIPVYLVRKSYTWLWERLVTLMFSSRE